MDGRSYSIDSRSVSIVERDWDVHWSRHWYRHPPKLCHVRFVRRYSTKDPLVAGKSNLTSDFRVDSDEKHQEENHRPSLDQNQWWWHPVIGCTSSDSMRNQIHRSMTQTVARLELFSCLFTSSSDTYHSTAKIDQYDEKNQCPENDRRANPMENQWTTDGRYFRICCP